MMLHEFRGRLADIAGEAQLPTNIGGLMLTGAGKIEVYASDEVQLNLGALMTALDQLITALKPLRNQNMATNVTFVSLEDDSDAGRRVHIGYD